MCAFATSKTTKSNPNKLNSQNAQNSTWMSQEVSKWLVNGLFHLLINVVYWGYSPLILTIDPNFRWDIQVDIV